MYLSLLAKRNSSLSLCRTTFKEKFTNRFRFTNSFFVQILTTGGLAMVGDAICQICVEKREKFNFFRTARFGIVTTCLIAPIQFNWFRFLSKCFVTEKGVLMAGAKRMLCDQIIAAPILTLACIFTLSTLQNLFNFSAAFEHTKQIFGPVILTNYKIWPFVQIINMSFVPLPFRVIFIQFVAVFWNMYFSHITNV